MGPVQTVEGYLNYTKFSHFPLLDVEETALKKAAKPAPLRLLHRYPEALADTPVEDPFSIIAMSPLGCATACSIPHQHYAIARFC